MDIDVSMKDQSWVERKCINNINIVDVFPIYDLLLLFSNDEFTGTVTMTVALTF